MARRKQNPNSAMPVLLMAGAGVAAYLAYTNGWFSSFTTTTVAVPTPKPSTSSGNPISSGAAIVGAPATPPPLGTVVNTASDIAAQAAANLAYIVPSAAAVNQAPNGYTMIHVTDRTVAPAGVIYLRTDIATKDIATANQIMNDLYAVAQTQYAAHLIDTAPTPQAPYDANSYTLANLQSGVSGLGRLNGWR